MLPLFLEVFCLIWCFNLSVIFLCNNVLSKTLVHNVCWKKLIHKAISQRLLWVTNSTAFLYTWLILPCIRLKCWRLVAWHPVYETYHRWLPVRCFPFAKKRHLLNDIGCLQIVFAWTVINQRDNIFPHRENFLSDYYSLLFFGEKGRRAGCDTK